MADRKLRSGTKKDYKKMASVGDDVYNISDEESGAEKCQEDGEHNNENENKHAGADSERDESENGESSSEGSSDDEEIKQAQERLKSLKKQQKKLKKERKLQHLAREAEEIENQLKQARSKGTKKKKRSDENVVTVASLRGMTDFVDEVDKLMDKKFNLKSGDSSDVGSSSSSDDSTGSGSDSGTEKVKKKGKRETSKTKKHRSSKSKKLTSYVPFPQKWPHSHLTLHFVSREKKFEELTVAEFCKGYIAILEMSRGSVKVHRTSHFKELMYLATKYQWRHVLNYHAACLMEIERGHLKWGDSFQLLQSTTLAGGILPSQSASTSGSRSWGASEGVAKEGGTVFCRFYQRGTCSQVGDHQGFFQGEKRLLKHICAECWLKSRKLEVHPQNSDVCPLK